MDDVNGAFEHQLRSVLQEAAGPSGPVDVPAVVTTATTMPGRLSSITRWMRGGFAAPTEGGFSMFSALKFVVAAAIVALFGGFLLAGVLTTQQDGEVPPAAVTESPSPMTSEELLSGMVTEEVEPGVYKVVNDGVRDLAYPGGYVPGFMVDVTPDGGVWLSGDTGGYGLFRLGEVAVFDDVEASPPYREVAPDGSLWGIGYLPDDRSGIFSFDGEGWTVRATTTDGFSALAIGPDGTVWVVWSDSGTALMRLEDDGSLTTIEDWADVYDGEAALFQLAVSPDGDVWLVGSPRYQAQGAELLLRFDGEGWEAIPGPERWDPGPGGRYLEFGPDGTLWMKADRVGGLARFDDPGWTTFTEADGLQPWGEPDFYSTDLLNAAADGSLWLLGKHDDGDFFGPGDGVAHYHDTTFTTYLADHYIHDFDIAPDGAVWVGARTRDSVGLYVITPEAVATKEQ